MWLETGMKLARLQYLLVFLTYRYQPPLRMGQFSYDHGTFREYEMEEEIRKYADARVEKLMADRIIPFQIRVLSSVHGP
jgi:hypothetical protein